MARKYVDNPKPDPELQRLIDERNRLLTEKSGFDRRGLGRSITFQKKGLAEFDKKIAAVEAKIASFGSDEPKT